MINHCVMILLPLLTGILTVVGFNYLDRTRFQVRGIIAPYFVSIALMFGLFTSLTASDVWQRISRANTLVNAEVNSLRSLLRLADAIETRQLDIRRMVAQHVNEVAESELRHITSTKPNNPDFQGLRDLYRIGVDPAYFSANTAVQSDFLRALEQVRSAHMERIELRQSRLSTTKLLIIFIFGLFTQFAIALCHAGNVRATWASVMLFSMTYAAAIWVLTSFDDPQNFASMISDRVFIDLQ